jgi:hypothetical protein
METPCRRTIYATTPTDSIRTSMNSSSENTEDERDAARRTVAQKTNDTDEEYEVLCALGLM